MSRTAHIDYEGLARTALSQAHVLLSSWFPAGKMQGREFIVGDLRGAPGESLSINTQTGKWADFSTDDRGGDLISLFAAMHGIGQKDAFEELSSMLGHGNTTAPHLQRTAKVTSMPLPESPEWNGIFPIPPDAPSPPKRHPTHGLPVHIAEYRDRHGRINALIYRCEPVDGRKQVVPLTFCSHLDGRREWRWQSLPKPRSLYHAELLDQRPRDRVLLVEGEPKCDAAIRVIGTQLIVMSWLGGAKAWRHVDWAMLAGRKVIIWPDADQPGAQAAQQIAAQLSHHRASARILHLPDGVPEGWDIGDAISNDGWNADRLMAFIDPPANPLPLIYFDDIKPSFDTLDFVENLLLSSSAIVIYGESNSGKTFFATDLALHVAAGLTWRNREVTQGGVVYVALEGSVGFRNRVEAWRREIADDARVVFAAIPASVNLLDPESDTPRLINAIRQAAFKFDMPVSLVVIDTLSRAMAGGNENAPDDMGALVMNMDAIRAATGAAVMFIHHSGKDQAKGARGHSLLRAAIDTEIEVASEEGNPARTATVVKQREMEKGAVFEFQLRTIELGDNARGKPVTSCVVEGLDSGHTAGAVPGRRLKGHVGRALEVLGDLLASAGKSGFAGIPSGMLSVPDKWWRDRFYEAAMAGSEWEAKKKAFARASGELIAKHVVGMANSRVWICRYDPKDFRKEDENATS